MSKKDIRPSPTFCTVTENWAGPENEARVPSTSVAVNCMFYLLQEHLRLLLKQSRY